MWNKELEELFKINEKNNLDKINNLKPEYIDEKYFIPQEQELKYTEIECLKDIMTKKLLVPIPRLNEEIDNDLNEMR